MPWLAEDHAQPQCQPDRSEDGGEPSGQCGPINRPSCGQGALTQRRNGGGGVDGGGHRPVTVRSAVMICWGVGGQPGISTSTGTTSLTAPTTPYPLVKTPPLTAQSPTAMTTRGSGTAWRVLSNGWRMLWVTTPVASNASSWRVEATNRAPKRSASYTGEKALVISSSQPLQEPQSTCRSWSEPVTPVGGAMATSGASGAGSTMRPTRPILPIQLIGPFPGTSGWSQSSGWWHSSVAGACRGAGAGLQVLEQTHLVGEQPGQYFAGQRQQLGHVLRGDGVDHVVALFAGHHHAGLAQHSELLGKVRRLQTELGQQLGH